MEEERNTRRIGEESSKIREEGREKGRNQSRRETHARAALQKYQARELQAHTHESASQVS